MVPVAATVTDRSNRASVTVDFGLIRDTFELTVVATGIEKNKLEYSWVSVDPHAKAENSTVFFFVKLHLQYVQEVVTQFI